MRKRCLEEKKCFPENKTQLLQRIRVVSYTAVAFICNLERDLCFLHKIGRFGVYYLQSANALSDFRSQQLTSLRPFQNYQEIWSCSKVQLGGFQIEKGMVLTSKKNTVTYYSFIHPH